MTESTGESHSLSTLCRWEPDGAASQEERSNGLVSPRYERESTISWPKRAEVLFVCKEERGVMSLMRKGTFSFWLQKKGGFISRFETG
jgi:hypothetical protein